MSYSKTSAAEKRPIYGMLFGYKKPSEARVSAGAGSWYGDVVAIMKPTVKSHATVTGHDSLDKAGGLIPTPMLKPSRYMFDSVLHRGSALKEAVTRVREKKPLSVGMFDDYRYAEVQIHGGHAKVSNIQHLIFGMGAKLSKAQEKRLKSLGITWSREGDDTIH